MMKSLWLLVLAVLLVSLNSVAFAKGVEPQFEDDYDTVHRWYAGTSYEGKLEAGGFDWDCAKGRCVLVGAYGTGLNMSVCQELAQKVGGLTYYYNSAGQWWTKHESPARLRECNNPNRRWFGLR
jgi:hypothetical protein